MFVTISNMGGGSCPEWYFTRERGIIRDKGCDQFLMHSHIRDKLHYGGWELSRNVFYA